MKCRHRISPSANSRGAPHRLGNLAVDLFAGCGGASLGFKSAGFEVLFGVEMDPTSARTYAENHSEVPLFVADIRSLDPDNVLGSLGLCPEEVTVVLGCPPCQGFSAHRTGRMTTADPRNELVTVFGRWVVQLQPLFFVFENVPGVERQDPSVWEQTLSCLREAGYTIAKDIVEAADFGVPQRRQRLVALGTRIPGVYPRLPSVTHSGQNMRPLRAWVTVRQAIGDLPPLESGESWPGDFMHRAPQHSGQSLRRFAAIPPDGGSRDSLPAKLQLRCHKEHDGHRDVYGRLRWDAPASTITAGCTQPSKGRFVHPEQHRGLTLREAARLQGFPDSYRFKGTKQQVAAQIGNAVPPQLAYALGTAVMVAQVSP